MRHGHAPGVYHHHRRHRRHHYDFFTLIILGTRRRGHHTRTRNEAHGNRLGVPDGGTPQLVNERALVAIPRRTGRTKHGNTGNRVKDTRYQVRRYDCILLFQTRGCVKTEKMDGVRYSGVSTYLVSFLEERKAGRGKGFLFMFFHSHGFGFTPFGSGSGLGTSDWSWGVGVWVLFVSFHCPVSLDEERRAWVLGCVVLARRVGGVIPSHLAWRS